MASVPELGLASALAEIAREINAPTDLETTLQTIVRSAARSLPGIDHVGITITHRRGRMQTMAATDPFVRDLDDLQYQLGEGPCIRAIEMCGDIVIERAEHETRWPRFMAVAIERGLRSQMGIALFVEKETLGGLNMYSTSSDTLDPETVLMAELFATHAALAMGHARREEQLKRAIDTRQVIGQATGIIMERYRLSGSRAFDYLIRVSSHSNLKLRDVAQEVVDGGTTMPRLEAGRV
jgi:transcriptional regulator with GAF, ATPase, and Fis domain